MKLKWHKSPKKITKGFKYIAVEGWLFDPFNNKYVESEKYHRPEWEPGMPERKEYPKPSVSSVRAFRRWIKKSKFPTGTKIYLIHFKDSVVVEGIKCGN